LLLALAAERQDVGQARVQCFRRVLLIVLVATTATLLSCAPGSSQGPLPEYMARYPQASDDLRQRWRKWHGEPPVLANDADLDWASAVVVLARTSCFGTCPTYSVGLSASGAVLYRGNAFVATCGDVRAQVSRGEAARVFEALRDIHFLDLIWDKECGFGRGTDAPSAVVTLKVSGVERTLADDLGDDCSPKQLRLLEELVDHIAGTRTWTSCGSMACCNVCPGEQVGRSMLRYCE
jgi:hypothetical protein